MVQSLANGVRLGSLQPDSKTKIKNDERDNHDGSICQKNYKNNSERKKITDLNSKTGNDKEYVQIGEKKIKDRAQIILYASR